MQYVFNIFTPHTHNSSTIHTLFLSKPNLAPYPLHMFLNPLTPICITQMLLDARSPTEAWAAGQEPHA